MDDSRAVIERFERGSELLVPYVLEYNKSSFYKHFCNSLRQEKSRIFKQNSHTCQICMIEQPGEAFSEVNSCYHAYCNMCLREMWFVFLF